LAAPLERFEGLRKKRALKYHCGFRSSCWRNSKVALCDRRFHFLMAGRPLKSGFIIGWGMPLPVRFLTLIFFPSEQSE
jgi:hypothetical protein